MKSLTIPIFYEYLTELPLSDLEAELSTATDDLKQAEKEYKDASSYGGFKVAQRIASRRKSAANELIKYCKVALKERKAND